jgi:hypothetical protein
MASTLISSRTIRPSSLVLARPTRKLALVTKAGAGEQVSRRVLGGLLGAGLLAISSAPSEAAFGEAARVFGGKATNTTGYVPYRSDDFSLLLPARWEPTEERDSKNVLLRYVDTYPANNLMVMKTKTAKNSVKEFGDPQSFLKEVNYLFGDNVWQGASRSEGGFKPNQVSTASLLDSEMVTGKDGKDHMNLHVLIRSADGNEGGKHHLISAAVSNGQLYIMKAQIGDKRWNKGGSRDSKTLQDSFAVA